MPNISIAMTTYNGERFLEEQIDSLLNQTLLASEIIVCDDLSEDNTIHILEKYQQKGILKYFINKKRLGVIENFKQVVSLTNKDNCIALCDQDDLWRPNKLMILNEMLSKLDNGQTPSMVYSDLEVITEFGETLNKSFWNELGQDTYQHCFDTLLFGNFVTGCSVLMNTKMREHFLNTPINASMHDAWLALIAYSIGMVDRVADPLVKYRKHGRNTAYRSSHLKMAKLEKRLHTLRNVFNQKNYLDEEINTASLFYNQYKESLDDRQRKMVLNVASLKNKSFLSKKILLHKIFWSKWIS